MALFTCNISTTIWLKRIIITLFLLLFCSTIKIFPIHIQTKIITKRVSGHIDLREEPKVFKSSYEHNNLEKGLKRDFNIHSNDRENRYPESTKKGNNTKDTMDAKEEYFFKRGVLQYISYIPNGGFSDINLNLNISTLTD